jgi:hypothetical protein
MLVDSGNPGILFPFQFWTRSDRNKKSEGATKWGDSVLDYIGGVFNCICSFLEVYYSVIICLIADIVAAVEVIVLFGEYITRANMNRSY